MALGYLLSARNLHVIDKGVRAGSWSKDGNVFRWKGRRNCGLWDIGKNTVARCQAFGLRTNVYDPGVQNVVVVQKMIGFI